MAETRKRILVVDDEEEIVSLLKEFLIRANYEAMAVTDSREVRQAAIDFKPDLIILDILMPEMDGGEVAGQLSENPATSGIPIVFLTGTIITKQEESRVRKTGRHYLMAKPASQQEVLAMIKQVLAC